MEHLHHFHLNQDPFQNEPDLRFYFDSACHRDVQVRVERGLRQYKGLCVLTGEGGTGKTLLARRILDALEEELFDANLMVMLVGASDAVSVLTRFARQLGVDEPSGDRPTLLAELYEQLCIIREDGRHCVLILDDAQILNGDAMAEIGGLLNLEYEDRRLVSLLFVGLPELDVTISRDSTLAQRVDVRVQLRPLDIASATAYLAHRLGVVGGSAEIFAQHSIDALFKFARGRPRLLNTIADNALFEAYLDGCQQVEAEHIERSAADLGIGLDPGSTYSDLPSARGVEPDRASARGLAQPEAVAECTDLDVAPALELSTLAVPGEDEPVDLGTLLVAEPDADLIDDGDLTVVAMEPGMIDGPASTRDLDRDMETVLAEAAASSGEFPEFVASNRGGGINPEATRIEFVPEPEPEDEIDDLFVELIED